MTSDIREILILVIQSITTTSLIIHMYMEDKREQQNAFFKTKIIECLHQLIELNQASLPWIEKSMSQEERDLLQDILDDYKG